MDIFGYTQLCSSSRLLLIAESTHSYLHSAVFLSSEVFQRLGLARINHPFHSTYFLTTCALAQQTGLVSPTGSKDLCAFEPRSILSSLPDHSSCSAVFFWSSPEGFVFFDEPLFELLFERLADFSSCWISSEGIGRGDSELLNDLSSGFSQDGSSGRRGRRASIVLCRLYWFFEKDVNKTATVVFGNSACRKISYILHCRGIRRSTGSLSLRKALESSFSFLFRFDSVKSFSKFIYQFWIHYFEHVWQFELRIFLQAFFWCV